MKQIKVRGFDLRITLESGQFFNYISLRREGFLVIDNKCFFVLQQSGERLFFDGNCDEEHLIRLFSLDKPYETILNQISRDEYVKGAIKRNYGLRVMRQDLWQCTISFICSAASNIPRIRSNVLRLSRLFGKKYCLNGHTYYLFPSPSILAEASERDIAQAGVGFRAKYIKEAAHWFSKGNHLDLLHLSHQEARKLLMGIKGVGRKIAECICLFSLGFDDAFPVDVWIKREIERQYFRGEAKSIEEIESFGRSYFGEHCGWAQQFIYHNARTLHQKNSFVEDNAMK